MILVDEADRLKVPSLEQLRDLFDRSDIGLILIGMPGISGANREHGHAAADGSVEVLRRGLKPCGPNAALVPP